MSHKLTGGFPFLSESETALEPKIPRVAIIQARLGSTRRPGKSVALIQGKQLIHHVIERALEITKLGMVFLAMPSGDSENPLEKSVKSAFGRQVSVARGSMLDVQSRFVQIASKVGQCNIARITADDPFKDPNLFSRAFDLLEDSSVDYVSTREEHLPLGLGVEVFSSSALIQSARKFVNPENREHVTLALRFSRDFERSELETLAPAWNSLRLTVDTEDDLLFCDEVARRIKLLGGSYDYRVTIEAARNALKKKEI